jgi:hypothetical protein
MDCQVIIIFVIFLLMRLYAKYGPVLPVSYAIAMLGLTSTYWWGCTKLNSVYP